MCTVLRLTTFSFLIALASISAFGQDLGSSNKLFGGTKTKSASPSTKSASPSTKKPPAKRKAPPAKAKTKSPATAATKSTKASSKPEIMTSSSSKTTPAKIPGNVTSRFGQKTSAAKTGPKPKVEISSSQPRELTGPSNAAADELFEKLIEDGNDARDDRNYTGAEAAYKRAKSIKPRDSRAVFGLGNLYSDQQRWDDAEAAYRNALQLEPGNAIVYIALSYVLSQPIVVPNLSERYEEAERFARRSIEIDPKNALAFDQLGVAMELRGLISSETENAYRNSIRLDPAFAPPYAHLGRLLRRRGLTKESAAAYRNAIQHSTDVATMILVADVMQSEQRFAESEPLLREAIQNDPRNPTGLLLLGRALTTLGNFSDAERFLRKSLDVSPNAFMSNCLLGSLYTRQGKYELAETALMQALRSVSANEKRQLSLQFESVGDGYLKVGRAKNAERAFRQAITLDVENEILATKLRKAQRS